MALDRNATLKPNAVNYFVGKPGTPVPTDLRDPGEEWDNVGHTSPDELLNGSTEGGETTNHGSAQDSAMRQSVSRAIRSFVINLLQWDDASLTLFFGTNIEKDENGYLDVPDTPQPSEVAWLAVLVDGDRVGGFYSAQTSAIGQGDISIADLESLAQLPVQFTPQKYKNGKSSLKAIPMKSSSDSSGGDGSGE